jgi:hypothetical protein
VFAPKLRLGKAPQVETLDQQSKSSQLAIPKLTSDVTLLSIPNAGICEDYCT